MSPTNAGALTGVRVLDLTRVLAGPTCARTLAEHGADVLRITAPHLPSLGYQEYDTGHGKLSAFLDLRRARDLDGPALALPGLDAAREIDHLAIPQLGERRGGKEGPRAGRAVRSRDGARPDESPCSPQPARAPRSRGGAGKDRAAWGPSDRTGWCPRRAPSPIPRRSTP